ncbi:MAG: hypothetical protein AAGG44_10765 [Planctomycetota bacterium]
MSISSPELWKRIAQEGIASPLQCRTWATEAAKSLSSQDAADGLKMAVQLIELGYVTKYQAKSLVGQSDLPLRLGRFHILQKLKSPTWRGWFEVAELDLARAKQSVFSWALSLEAAKIEGMQARKPSLKRAIAISHIREPGIQQTHVPELIEEPTRVLLLRAQPIEGKPLSECVVDQIPSKPECLQIIEQATVALASLHRAGIVHGLPNPERICWDGEMVQLVIDPVATESPLGTETSPDEGVLQATFDPAQRMAFLAPEFVAPQQSPSFFTDVFVLAKTWSWLLGDREASYPNTEDALAANAQLSLSHDAAELDEPLKKVLLHGLAPDPAHRFPNAGDFAQALRVAREVIDQGPIPVTAKPVAAAGKPAEVAQKSVGAAADTVEAKKPSGEPASVRERAQKQKPSSTASEVSKPVVKEPSTARNQRAADLPKATPVERSAPAKKSPIPEKQNVSKDPATDRQKRPAEKVADQPKPKGKLGQPKQNTGTSKQNSDKPNTPSAKSHSSAKKSSDGGSPTPAKTRPSASNPASSALVEQTEKDRHKAKPGLQALGSSIATTDTKAKPKNSSVTNASSSTKRKSGTRGSRRRQSNKWMLPVVGGFGFLIVLLLALQFSGALEGMRRTETASKPKPAYVPSTTTKPTVIEKDPLLDFYNVVDGGQGLWAPLNPPDPPPLDLLPPGAGLFIWLRVERILEKPQRLGLGPLWAGGESFERWISGLAGIDLDAIDSVVVAMYAPLQDGGFPASAVRVNLKAPVARDQFASMVDGSASWMDQNQLSSASSRYFVPNTDDASVVSFSAGPPRLMDEVAELQGGSGPLLRNVETLFESSSREDDVVLVASAPFLVAEGRGLLGAVPQRGQTLLKDLLGVNARAVSVASSMEESWFYELRLVGTANQEAASFAGKLDEGVRGLAEQVEAWFVEESPHPHWRALALRYPQMLRAFSKWTRISVEDGVAVANGYLPIEAADNLLLASSIALQDAATIEGSFAGGGSDSQPSSSALTTAEFLARRITLSFDQEPIEEAFRMVAEEANTGLPAGTPTMQFRLDGDAFELAGITRNFQLRDFQHRDAPVRDALTEIARRGNSDSTVTDLTSPNQTLVWSVQSDPNDDSKDIITLTTRAAVAAVGAKLASEFGQE